MHWFGEHLWETWLGLAILLGLLELLSLDFVLLMLAMGALVGMVADMVGLPFPIQALAAAIASVAMLTVVRPGVVRRLHTGPELRLGHNKHVGHEAIVTEAISAQDHGRIKLAGEIWSAAPYDDLDTIAAGETVEVVEIRGATAYVHPIPRLEP
jgi:membrane protein implicated in regulation of membrane protease activity